MNPMTMSLGQAQFEALCVERYGHHFPAELKNGANFLGLMLFIACQKLGAEYTEEKALDLVAASLKGDGMGKFIDGVWLPGGSQTTSDYLAVMIIDRTERDAYRDCMGAALGLPAFPPREPSMFEHMSEAERSAWPPTLEEAMAMADDDWADGPQDGHPREDGVEYVRVSATGASL